MGDTERELRRHLRECEADLHAGPYEGGAVFPASPGVCVSAGSDPLAAVGLDYGDVLLHASFEQAASLSLKRTKAMGAIARSATRPPFYVSLFPPMYDHKVSELIWSSSYERVLTELIVRLARRDAANSPAAGLFVDVGSSVGWFTMLAHALGLPAVAFEPQEAIAEHVVTSIALAGLDPRDQNPRASGVRLHVAAIGRRGDTAKVFPGAVLPSGGLAPGSAVLYPSDSVSSSSSSSSSSRSLLSSESVSSSEPSLASSESEAGDGLSEAEMARESRRLSWAGHGWRGTGSIDEWGGRAQAAIAHKEQRRLSGKDGTVRGVESLAQDPIAAIEASEGKKAGIEAAALARLLNEDKSGSASSSPDAKGRFTGFRVASRGVNAKRVTLDSMVRTAIYFLRIGTGGSADRVVRSAARLLRHGLIENIVFEYRREYEGGGTGLELLEFLQARGMSRVRLVSHEWVSRLTIHSAMIIPCTGVKASKFDRSRVAGRRPLLWAIRDEGYYYAGSGQDEDAVDEAEAGVTVPVAAPKDTTAEPVVRKNSNLKVIGNTDDDEADGSEGDGDEEDQGDGDDDDEE